MEYGDATQFKINDFSIVEVVKAQFEQMLQVIESEGLEITDGTIQFKHAQIRDPECDTAIGWLFKVKEQEAKKV